MRKDAVDARPLWSEESILRDMGDTGRSMRLSGARQAAVAGEWGSDAGGESRARLAEDRIRDRKGPSLWDGRVGGRTWRSPGGGVVLPSMLVGVMMVGCLRRKRGRRSMVVLCAELVRRDGAQMGCLLGL